MIVSFIAFFCVFFFFFFVIEGKFYLFIFFQGFPGGSDGKEPASAAGDLGLILG